MSKLKGSTDLTQGPIGRQLFFFALPILAGNVSQSLSASINTMWIGRFLGDTALTAASNANTVLFFLISVVFGAGMATTILLGQATGSHDKKQTQCIIGTSLTLFVGIALAVSALGFQFTPLLLDTMHTPAVARQLAIDYLRTIFLGVSSLFLFTFLSAALRGIGDSRTPLRFLLLAITLDISLNPLLIFGLGPVPAMGIMGSAWAMVASQTLALLALVWHLFRRQHLLWLGRQNWHYFKIQWPIARLILVKGLPMGLQLSLFSLSLIAIVTLVNPFGTQTAAAYGAASQLWAYIQMPAIAVGAACSTMASQNMGARLWDRVTSITHYGVLWNCVMTGLLTGIILLFEHPLLRLFIPEQSQAMTIGLHLNRIVIGSFSLFGIVMVISSVVRAAGFVIPPLVILAVSLWGIRIPLAHLLIHWLGSDGIWWSFPISSLCAAALSLAYYRWGHWRNSQALLR